MAKITYIEHNGTVHSVDVAEGTSVMEGAVQNGIPGIDGDCGGACACATCHVHVHPDWLSKVGEQNDLEKDMLEFSEGVSPNSRLSCQIAVSPALDGLVVHMPESQR